MPDRLILGEWPPEVKWYDEATQVGMQHHSTDDCMDCEICGAHVRADQLSGFAARSGAVIHINCLAAQMDQ